jgi:hypothetical protein
VDGSRTGDARSDGLDPGMTILNHIGFTNDRYRRASQASFLNSFRRFPGTRAQVSGPDGRTTLSGVAFLAGFLGSNDDRRRRHWKRHVCLSREFGTLVQRRRIFGVAIPAAESLK